MLKKMRCSGLRPEAYTVDCAHALTAAIQTASAGGIANNAQKFTVCDSERFDWLRPSGSSILAEDVATPAVSKVTKSRTFSRLRRTRSIAATRHSTPAAITAAT